MNNLSRLLTALALTPLLGCSYLKHDASPAANQLSAAGRFELAAKCGTAGREYFEKFAKEWNTFDARHALLWDEPEYHYNSRLETCLVHIRFVQPLPGGGNDSRHFSQTIDVLSDRVILYGWFSRDDKTNAEALRDTMGDAPNYTSAEYSRQKEILFSE
jgi:hypothetical protein